MVAMSALVFGLSWWLGLYLLARNPRKPVLVLAAIGLIGYSVVVALDAIRVTPGSDAELLGRIEVFTAIIPSVAWLMVLLELTNSGDRWRDRAAMAVPGVVLAVVLLVGASLAGTIAGPARLGHWIMFCANGTAAIGAAILLFRRRASIPGSARGVVLVATMFFTLGDAQLIIPLGIVPSWLALASTGFDLVLLGLGVALWDAFDEGQALRGDMLRSFVASILVGALFGAQAMIGIAVVGQSVALVVLLFTSMGLAICIQVQSAPFADFLDRLAFSRSPQLRQERSELRSTEAALPLKSASPIAGVDDESFTRLTRRALSHYGDLAKLVASPLAALPVIDERLAGRGASDQPSNARTNSERYSPSPSHGSNLAMTATSVPPINGATTTRCTSRTSWVCGHMPRGQRLPAWTRYPVRRGSGWSPRYPSVPCTTGRTRRRNLSRRICVRRPPRCRMG